MRRRRPTSSGPVGADRYTRVTFQPGSRGTTMRGAYRHLDHACGTHDAVRLHGLIAADEEVHELVTGGASRVGVGQDIRAGRVGVPAADDLDAEGDGAVDRGGCVLRGDAVAAS